MSMRACWATICVDESSKQKVNKDRQEKYINLTYSINSPKSSLVVLQYLAVAYSLFLQNNFLFILASIYYC